MALLFNKTVHSKFNNYFISKILEKLLKIQLLNTYLK